MRGQTPISAHRHIQGTAVKAAHQRGGAESCALMGLMRRAIAREEQERAKAMDEQRHILLSPNQYFVQHPAAGL